MKILISFLLIISCSCFCQDKNSFAATNNTGKDSINIRQIVMQQIARVKNEKIIKSENKSAVQNDFTEETKSASAAGNWLQRIFILADFSLAVMLFIVWRRKKLNISKEENTRLKKNVIKLRSDRVEGRPDLALSAVRVNLQSRAIGKRFDDENISLQARQLSISKGELYLASKLKAITRRSR